MSLRLNKVCYMKSREESDRKNMGVSCWSANILSLVPCLWAGCRTGDVGGDRGLGWIGPWSYLPSACQGKGKPCSIPLSSAKQERQPLQTRVVGRIAECFPMWSKVAQIWYWQPLRTRRMQIWYVWISSKLLWRKKSHIVILF